jgi:2-polyprenyl-3-methyl-5-hydroxy-6-metoxy-1,4-benzoquinol methylase
MAGPPGRPRSRHAAAIEERAVTRTIVTSIRRWLSRPPAVAPSLVARFRDIDGSALDSIEEALREHYFSKQSGEYLDTEHGRRDLEDHRSRRLETARRTVVPWLDHVRPLQGARILEIGTGTGSDLVALAEQGADVVGVDLDSGSLRVAEHRAKTYGVRARLVQANATTVAQLFAADDFDFIIFFASLEHMVHAERLLAMASTWQMLRPGALWCVV